MIRNQKLTALVRGRSILGVDTDGTTVRVRFDDGSIMTVLSDGSAPTGEHAGTVAVVRQENVTLMFEFDDGNTLSLHTAEPTASVMVRDKAQRFEYAD